MPPCMAGDAGIPKGLLIVKLPLDSHQVLYTDACHLAKERTSGAIMKHHTSPVPLHQHLPAECAEVDREGLAFAVTVCT